MLGIIHDLPNINVTKCRINKHKTRIQKLILPCLETNSGFHFEFRINKQLELQKKQNYNSTISKHNLINKNHKKNLANFVNLDTKKRE